MSVNKKRCGLVVISGPSGCGKSSICKELTKNPQIKQSVSYTTRKPREGERDGVDYYFVKRNEFEALIRNNKFIEYAEYCGHLYGTPIGPVEEAVGEKKIILLVIDVQGAMQIMKKMPDSIHIFIMPPDVETLKFRLKNRLTEDEDTINKRIVAARKEMESSRHYDYCVINDRLDDAITEIEEILQI
ncbi:guanylate kinase [Candidatus Scalindua japonica]|uniref:Guanylate kinase n=1 Tax=Candidatus Scalindua japonica TaxID=1284222 RepID=A0A286TUW0_9BACT|nr:guanylate kinase [Candidatus Scalindua japonica]GAX59644.1 guanylate kinase [Candidatus Scalindua japonica]